MKNNILFTGEIYQVDTVNNDGTITVSNEKHTITIIKGEYKVLSKQDMGNAHDKGVKDGVGSMDFKSYFQFIEFVNSNYDYHDNTSEGDLYKHQIADLIASEEDVFEHWLAYERL